MVENLLTGLLLANPRLRPGADPQKSPGVDRAQETGADPLLSNPLPRLSVLPSMWHPFIEMVR
jgi:hypothetical protein